MRSLRRSNRIPDIRWHSASTYLSLYSDKGIYRLAGVWRPCPVSAPQRSDSLRDGMCKGSPVISGPRPRAVGSPHRPRIALSPP
ncbi:hypothetical protein LG3211_1275 [Lysobacter gummosus]|nr:hypothetical protein LG3211_1275 [Lysobacter gummosus]